VKTVTKLSLWVGVVGLACFGFALDATASSSPLSLSTATPAYVASLVIPHIKDSKPPKKHSVPEGGSAILYLGLAGLSCFGAIMLRSRMKAKETA